MTPRPLTHDHCAQRVCCPSWSCGPHMAECSTVGRHPSRSYSSLTITGPNIVKATYRWEPLGDAA